MDRHTTKIQALLLNPKTLETMNIHTPNTTVLQLTRLGYLVCFLMLICIVLLNPSVGNASTYASHNSLWCDQSTVDEAFLEIGDGLLHQTNANEARGPSLLALSGGGSRGAWGAGFLVGWQSQHEKPKSFDLVTGVSVGALLSTYAYISDYDGMKEVMENIRSRDVYRRRIPVLWPLLAPSKYANGRLLTTLEKTVGPEQLRAVAKREEPGLLCVATVEMRTGVLVKWNMTGIAEKFVESSTDEERESWLKLYHKVLVAATSVPGAFPPQKIVMPEFASDRPLPFTQSSWHIDAGVRTQVFGDVGKSELLHLYGNFLDMAEENDATNRLGPAEVYMVINNANQVDEEWTPPKRALLPLAKLATRSVELILNQTAKGSRERLIEGVRHQLGSPGEGKWHLNIASMTVPELLNCGALNFSCAWKYFREGEERGKASDWDEISTAPISTPQ